jgi:hypothetical protein
MSFDIPGKKSDLSPECQKFVTKLFAFYSKEKATKKPIVTFDRVYQKTSTSGSPVSASK